MSRREPLLARRILVLGFVIGLALSWFVLLRPQSLGGPAGYVLVSGRSMHPTLRDGDLALVRRAPSYAVGDIVAFRVSEGEFGAGGIVIHRIVGGSPSEGYVMRGDNKPYEDLWRPGHGDVVGRVWIRVPGAGRVLRSLRRPFTLASVAALLVFAAVASGGGSRTRSRTKEVIDV
jgi:signal peptidase